ncbi:MAG: class I SAM-dependent methyltransferase [bacterium]
MSMPPLPVDPAVYQRLRDWAHSNSYKRIALYGAGQHTIRLLAQYTPDPQAGFTIACIVDDQSKASELNGIPVIVPAALRNHAVDAIMISSDTVEDKLYAQALSWGLPIQIGRLHRNVHAYRDPAVGLLMNAIEGLPVGWHAAGTMQLAVLHAMARWSEKLCPRVTLETGAGMTSLLFSHVSPCHTVFAIDIGDSLGAVRRSPLLRGSSVTFVEGPTQLTLPRHTFAQPIDMALIDGPHGYPFPEIEYYYIYPHLRPGSLLIVDDIHIPTIRRLFEFLQEDEMFRLEEVVLTTAFFARTQTPTFPPTEDGWWLQGYNRNHFPLEQNPGLKTLLRR